MIERGKFYHGEQGVCKSLFSGKLNQGQVDTMEALFNEWDRRVAAKEIDGTQLDWLAYIMATDYRECGINMVPVREGFATSDEQARRILTRAGYWYAKVDPRTGQMYYGRGIVQVTHYNNYLALNKIKDRLRVEKKGLWADVLPADSFVEKPDLLLQPPVAVWATFEGMLKLDSGVGDYTGVSLETYTKNGRLNFVQARHVINGLDHADEIAANAEKFYTALKAAYRKGDK